MIRRALPLGILAAVLATPALAAPPILGGTVEVNAGYDTNPFFSDNDGGGSANVGLSLAPSLTWRGETGETVLSGRVGRVQYFKDYGHSELYQVNLSRTQQFSATLSGNAGAYFVDSTSALLSPIDLAVSDIISSNQRQRSFGGNAGLTWNQTERDQWTLSGQINRSTYPGARRFSDRPGGIGTLGDLTDYGGTLGYFRTLTARTSVGASVGYDQTESAIYPDSRSISPNINFRQQLSAIWSLDGGVGVILSRSRYAGVSNNSTTLGFDLKLCGTYPRLTTCFTGHRGSSPSGYGGQRTQTQVAANINYKLTERDTITGDLVYAKEKSLDFTGLTPSLSYGEARVSYDRLLTERLSTGVTGSYRRQKYQIRGTDDGASVFVYLRAKLGRM